MKYKLKLTTRQSSLIQSHIYDLCNIRLNCYRDFNQINTTDLDQYDILRAKLYFKEKKIKGKNTISFLYSELTLQELYFIKHELTHFVLSGHFQDFIDRSDVLSAKGVIKKIDNLVDVQHQRTVKLKSLGI